MPAKKVKRISPSGNIDVVYYSKGQWAPTNGLFDKDGNLWLLEYGDLGNCRMNKIDSAELTAKPNIHKPEFMNYILIFASLLIITLISIGSVKLTKVMKRKALF